MRFAIIGGDPGYLLNFRGALIQTATSLGHEVLALAQSIPEKNAEIDAGIRALGARYDPFQLDRHGTNPIDEAKTVRELAGKLRSFRPDVVLCYTPKMITWGTMAAKAASLGRKTSIHALMTGLGSALTAGERDLKTKIVHGIAGQLLRSSLLLTDQVIFQNPDDRADLQKAGLLGKRKRTAIVNGSGVDTEAFPFTPRPPGAVTFLQVGRIQKLKGVREFVEAARRVKQDYPDIRVRLVGPLETGPGGAFSEAQVKEWIADGTLEWPGKSNDVCGELQRCSVFVLPSYREGTPRSVLEALSIGRAVITCDAPGCRETVNDGENGFLVEPRSADSVERAMRRFLEEPELIETMGDAARKMAENKYDVRLVNAEMMRLMGLS